MAGENGDLGKIVKLLEKAAQGAEEAAALAEAELEAELEAEQESQEASLVQGFRNQFHYNDTCLLITIIFLFAFIYFFL